MPVEEIKKLLDSEDFGDRLRGINQLRQLDTATAFELIRPLINDGHVRVRYAAVCQLDTLGQENLIATQVLLVDRLNNDPEADVQAAAADAIAALKLTDAFPQLEQKYYQTPEWLVKFSIVAALGEMGDSRAFPLLVDALSSDVELIQTAAVSSLGELGDTKSVELLIPLAKHADWQVRYRVAAALHRLNDPAGADALAQLAQDSIAQVAMAAQGGQEIS